MKRMLACLLSLLMLLSCLPVLAENEMGVQIIGDDTPAGDTLQVGETMSIDKVCDFTIISYVADTYAFSIPAYERPDDETIRTPEHKSVKRITGSDSWGSYDRYKYKDNESGKPGYAIMYDDIYAAYKAQSDDYKLLDVRVNILNKMITPMNVGDTFTASVKFMDEYEFPITYTGMEIADTLGHSNEWLVDAEPIPMLVEKTIHFVFEVPNIVTTSTESLVMNLSVNNEDYEFVIR